MSTEEPLNERENTLKTKQICRFCLSQQIEKLGSIYQRDARLKSSAPLPVQVMACASIEVFSNDGMPSKVCCDCRLLFEHAYRFKQMCKRAETLLKQYPLTGKWPIPLTKPKFPKELLPNVTSTGQQVQQQQQPKPSTSVTKTTTQTASNATLNNHNNQQQQKITDFIAPKKLLNANPVDSPEPPVPMRMKKEKLDEETTNFLNKVENNEELSMDDVQRLIAAADDEHVELLENDSSSVLVATLSQPASNQMASKSKPKLLNKSSIRILNKEADVVLEPRLSAPQLKRDVDGKMAMVTEILDPATPYEPAEIEQAVTNVTAVESIVFPCPHCERSFPLRQLRDIHMVNHTRSRSFHCTDCEKSFFSKYDLQKHNLIHSGDRPFKCTVCEKGFTRATLLHRHEKTHTDIPKFICIYCEKPFLSKEQMEKHAERHQKNRPFNCGVCNKSFAFKQGLERHEVIHSREQPYPCQYCDLSFSTPSKLARHLTAHAGQRPYPCKFCPKSYLLSHHLTRHLRSHKNGTVSFMCADCDKIFKSRDDLIYHSAVHATQTLICPLCKESFEDIQSVTTHIKEHAEGDAYACEFCDLIFMTAERLQEHTDVDHDGDMAAYHQDEKEQLQRAQRQKQQQQGTEEKDNGERLRIIEEFLEDDDMLNDRNEVVFKQENDWENQPSDKPQILDEIVFQSKMSSSNEENLIEYDDSNIIVANEAVEAEEFAPPASKTRKIVTASISQRVTKSTAQPTKPQQTKVVTPPQARRKEAQSTQSTVPIKIEKTDAIEEKAAPKTRNQTADNSTINSMLKMLPKSVSVRRNQSNSNDNNTTTSEKSTKSPTKQSPQQQQQRATRNSPRTSNEVTIAAVENAKVVKKPTSNNSSPASNSQQNVKKFQSNISPSAAASGATRSSNVMQTSLGAQKPVKMILGDKKVKVQKITITKAEAAAMAKDGRIRIKDGNMVLTRAPK